MFKLNEAEMFTFVKDDINVGFRVQTNTGFARFLQFRSIKNYAVYFQRIRTEKNKNKIKWF